MRLAILAFLGMTVIASASAAHAGVEKGKPPRGDHEDARAIARVRALHQLGDDVIRFSMSPALGSGGWVIELHRTGNASGAEGSITFTDRFRQVRRGRFEIRASRARFERLAAAVDATMLQPFDENALCTDGAGYMTERRRDGRNMWLAGECGQAHPNNAIGKLMIGIVREQLWRFHLIELDGPYPE